ncbi:TonB-dependent siderophore receptor [Flavobacterium sp. NRK1]|uniref:TonB-dependent receptor plug domain-containing protein n=1 Tax=Flavobacterium sp. NRK1 TaxID=2954929 RepID=UPI002093BA41|nr:TonB-dependent receptor plug domain-containing protein [Flavobacterium sp. NRK1]MCO6146822.1 TonB-dependent receptor plug domain-containing protein [Flavobacterium sp. NRK1]
MLFLPLFFIVPKAFGQDEKKSIELKTILDNISLQYNVKFNYAEGDIKGHSIFPPPKTLPLRAKLVYIANRTNLNYKEVGEYIVIYSGDKPGKKRCAYIIDEFGYPVGNAVIQLPDNEKIVTRNDGYFELPSSFTGIIYIDHLNFEPVSINIRDFTDDCKEIVLKLEILELEELVAERYLATGISKKRDGSFTIKPKKFGILPGLIEPDVLKTMQQLPGINSIDETVSNINVRGGTHDQNLFLWNGIRLYQTGHFFGLISALNPNLANEIKIFKNGTSAFYGESVSSAVDISSHTTDIGKGNFTIGANMINIDFYTKIKASENSNFELSARRAFTDVLDFPTYSKYSKRIFQNTVVTGLDNSTDVNYKSDKEFYFYDFTGQYHQKIGSKHNLYVDVIGINNNLDFTQGTINSQTVVTEFSSLKQLTLGASANWKSQWNDNHSSEAGFYTSYYNVDGRNAAIETQQIMEQGNKILDIGFKLADSQKITEQYNLHTGYQFNEVGIKNSDNVNEPSYNRTVKEVLRTHSAIGELDYDSENKKIHSRGGVRFNYIEQFSMFYAEPRLQFNYLLAPSWQLEVLAEMKSQTASQIVELQGDFLGIEKRRWVLSNNNDIPVQRSRQISIGATFKQNGWLISLENFYKKVKGITTAGQGFQDQLELRNDIGSYTVIGSEFLVQKQFKGFYTWLSYSYNNNNYRFNAFSDRKFPSSFEINHSINTAAIYEWNNFKVALGSKWFTGRPVTLPISSELNFAAASKPEITYNFPNSNNIENFFQVNFSATYVIKATENSQLQLGISVLNIFNRKNIINRYYRISSENNGIEVVNTYALERTPNALIKFSF